MIHLATTCSNGHLEFVPAISRRRGAAPYFGASAASCRHVIAGEFCAAEIQETQLLCAEHCALGTMGCPCIADLPLQATDCGISEPHAPGAHSPAVDMEPDEASYESGDDEEEDEFAAVSHEVREGTDEGFYSEESRLLRARAFLLHHPALIVSAALVSLAVAIYLAATGRWVLALLV